MPKKADIQPDSPEEVRARFEKAVDAAVKTGPRPASTEAGAAWARITKGPKSKPAKARQQRHQGR